jgi:hypothetical protein
LRLCVVSERSNKGSECNNASPDKGLNWSERVGWALIGARFFELSSATASMSKRARMLLLTASPFRKDFVSEFPVVATMSSSSASQTRWWDTGATACDYCDLLKNCPLAEATIPAA